MPPTHSNKSIKTVTIKGKRENKLTVLWHSYRSAHVACKIIFLFLQCLDIKTNHMYLLIL